MARKKKQVRSEKPYEVRLTEESSFHMKESYNSIRTNLQFTLASAGNRAFVVSSPSPAEGKSTTCANIAIAMAQDSKRVLLIDSDLRKPTQHQIFRLDNTHGLSSVLAGFGSLSDALQKDVEENLDIITSGQIPPNPSELLGSKRMDIFLDKIKDYYEFIILDSPPINLVTDGIILASKTAGVVLVSRQNTTTMASIEKAVEAVNFANSKVLGFIINDVDTRAGNYYYYNYNYNYS